MEELSLDLWEAGTPCEADGIPFCKRCKPTDLPEIVFVSAGGSAFHRIPDCEGLAGGQRSVDRRGGDVAPITSIHRGLAIQTGRLPCLVCLPEARGKV